MRPSRRFLPRVARRLPQGPGLYEQSGRGPLSRRTLLRGVLQGSAVSLSLPFLEIFLGREARACGGAIPRRFGLFFWGNGNGPDRWRPTGEGDDWELSEQLAPLASVKDFLTVITGMNVKLPNTEPHGSGAAGILSASSLMSVGGDLTFSQPTIDQVIASQIGGETLYASLQTAATDTYGLSYTGAGARASAETDPYALYERIFGDTFREPGEEVEVDPKLGLRRSVLDAVMGDISTLQGRVGSEDKVRLEQHLDGVRELEQRLARLEEDPPNLEACSRAEAPELSYPDIDGQAQASARNRVVCDMLAMALACDQTRVFAHFFSEPVSNVLYPGAPDGHHNLTHDESPPQDEVNAITVQIMEEFAYMLERFASVDEGDGTLLDNSVILGLSEVSYAQTHSLDDMPILLAGSACGRLRTNYHYKSVSGENATKVLLTLAQTMDLSLAEYGEDEGWTDEILDDIVL